MPMPTLLEALVAPSTGSANKGSALSRREFLVEKAPKPVVGEVVHVYGPQGIVYYRGRVFSVSVGDVRCGIGNQRGGSGEVEGRGHEDLLEVCQRSALLDFGRVTARSVGES